jgi:phage shock protein A
MGLLDRISRVFRANLNAAVNTAEDPEKMLEQAVLEMQDNQVQLRQAVAQAIAAQKRLEQQYNQNQTQAADWERKAVLSLQKGEEDLAREALMRKKTFAETAISIKTQLESSAQQVEKLKGNLTTLESKIAEAKTKKEMLIARARAAKANEQINEVMGRVDTTGSLAAFDRMADKVEALEAQSAAVAELAGDKLESQFAALEAGDVEDDMARLKASLGMPQALGTASIVAEALPPAEEAPANLEQSQTLKQES